LFSGLAQIHLIRLLIIKLIPLQGSLAEEEGEGDEELGAEDLGDEEEEQVHKELTTKDDNLKLLKYNYLKFLSV